MQTKTRRQLATPGAIIPPVPAMLLTVAGHADEPDEISVVFSFVINYSPAQIGISVNHEHIALQRVRQHGEFVLNVPVVSMIAAFDRADMNSKKSADKFAITGLTRGKASTVNAPTIIESPIHVECRVFDEVTLPPNRSMFLASVEATSVIDGVCDEDGTLIVKNVPFFGMTVGSGEFYTMGKRVGHIGQSVGRDDIKY